MKTKDLSSIGLISAMAIGANGCASTPPPARMVAMRPASFGSTPPESAVDNFYRAAASAIERRDYAQALELLQSARDKSPNDVRVLNAFGVVYDKLGRFDLSNRYYAQALAAAPGSTIVAENQAYSNVLQGGGLSGGAALASTATRTPSQASPVKEVAVATPVDNSVAAHGVAAQKVLASAQPQPSRVVVAANTPPLQKPPLVQAVTAGQTQGAASSVAPERHVSLASLAIENTNSSRSPSDHRSPGTTGPQLPQGVPVALAVAPVKLASLAVQPSHPLRLLSQQLQAPSASYTPKATPVFLPPGAPIPLAVAPAKKLASLAVQPSHPLRLLSQQLTQAPSFLTPKPIPVALAPAPQGAPIPLAVAPAKKLASLVVQPSHPLHLLPQQRVQAPLALLTPKPAPVSLSPTAQGVPLPLAVAPAKKLASLALQPSHQLRDAARSRFVQPPSITPVQDVQKVSLALGRPPSPDARLSPNQLGSPAPAMAQVTLRTIGSAAVVSPHSAQPIPPSLAPRRATLTETSGLQRVSLPKFTPAPSTSPLPRAAAEAPITSPSHAGSKATSTVSANGKPKVKLSASPSIRSAPARAVATQPSARVQLTRIVATTRPVNPPVQTVRPVLPIALKPAATVAVRAPRNAPAHPAALIGRRLVIVDATGNHKAAQSVLLQLAHRGWSVPSNRLPTATSRSQTTVRYSAANALVARALANSLKISVKLERCVLPCSGVSLILGADVRSPVRTLHAVSGQRRLS